MYWWLHIQRNITAYKLIITQKADESNAYIKTHTQPHTYTHTHIHTHTTTQIHTHTAIETGGSREEIRSNRFA